MNFRPARVGKLIQEELSFIITREVEFAGALVTICGVDVSKKLDTATVMISVFPSKSGGNAIKTLNRQQPQLQHLLARKLNIKPMPKIRFKLDTGPENAAAVEKIVAEGLE